MLGPRSLAYWTDGKEKRLFHNSLDGRLIDAAGLKGLRVGGAAVSEKHANFIVADSTATATDVQGLIDEVRRRVAEATGTVLQTEIRLVGFDAGPDEVKSIVAGTELASVAQFPAKMGSMGAQAALDAISGKTVEANIDTGTEMVTKDNAADFGG